MHHQHGLEARALRNRRALGIALALIAGFAAVELVAGLLAGSLALLADAAHMVSDTASLGLAFFAAWLALRPATPRRSFGFRRAEILAALFNGLALAAVSIWIFVAAIGRLGDPPGSRAVGSSPSASWGWSSTSWPHGSSRARARRASTCGRRSPTFSPTRSGPPA